MGQRSRSRIGVTERPSFRLLICLVATTQCGFITTTQGFGVVSSQKGRQLAWTTSLSQEERQFSPTWDALPRPSFVRLQSSKKGDPGKSGDDDIPADWSEDDLLAEFEDLDTDVSEVDVVMEEVEVEEDDDGLVVFEDDDDEKDDDDEIDIDLDEDDDDDFSIEEVFGSLRGDFIMADDEGDFVPVEWNEEEDGGEFELEDDPSDPNYMKQKELVEAAVKDSEERIRGDSFDALDFVMNEMTEDQAKMMEELPFMKEVEERARAMMLGESDVESIDIEDEVANAPDFVREDAYPRHERGETNFLERSTGLSDDDMEEFDKTYKRIRDTLDEEPWDKVMLKDMTGWDGVSNETLDEMDRALEELGGSSYNVTRWLLYDLDFNVSNLLLAAMKHNPEAPILLNHWYPQLITYSRYEHVRDRNFDFTWEDVDGADMDELKRYYEGFGYYEIPDKAPAETGVISLEDLDEEEIKMAAFENWMAEVYNPEWDRKDFDDDDMQDEDNVFSDFFEPPQHPDVPPFDDVEEDIADWQDEIGDDPAIKDYRDRMGQKFDYQIVRDAEFQKEFRGHLVIACSADDADLEVAEKITLRFAKEFGKKVWVETRVEALARDEDDVFEIWLESYEIDLLHSKKRANSSGRDWKGPAECDDAQIDYLVERVGFLISDDARYSYRFEFETVN